jgi:LPPG:FO 2-phospho-L-lactate transferase
VRNLLKARTAPLIVVSPIISGRAIKGPIAKIMTELDLEISTLSIAKHYGSLIDGYVIDLADERDSRDLQDLGFAVRCAPTLMQSLKDRVVLARHVLDFGQELKQVRKSG